jgi:hypothetical protein
MTRTLRRASSRACADATLVKKHTAARASVLRSAACAAAAAAAAAALDAAEELSPLAALLVSARRILRRIAPRRARGRPSDAIDGAAPALTG